MALTNAFAALALDSSVQALLTNEQLRAQRLDVEILDNVQGRASIGATNRPSLQYAAVLSGGTNYAVGDVITLGGGTPATVAMVEVTAGGKSKVRSAATTNATLLSSFLTTIYDVKLYNSGATVAWLKFYNKGTTPVVGTDVPVALYPIPPMGMLSIDAATSGLSMYQTTTGLGYAITGAMGDLDTTAVALDQIGGTIIFN